MTDDILFFCAKMMVGHDGLLSDMSVGRASLYQKIPSCPNFYLMCHRRWYKYPKWRNKMSSIFVINLVYPRDVNSGGVAHDQKGGLDGYQSAD